MEVVYEDLRQPLLEDLYRHSVEQARLGPVLEQLDDALGALCEATPKELHAGLGIPSLADMARRSKNCIARVWKAGAWISDLPWHVWPLHPPRFLRIGTSRALLSSVRTWR